MIYHATQIIKDHFEEKGIKFHVEQAENSSCVAAGYGIEGGPSILVRFISKDNDNDVAVRVFSVINDTPKDKELEMLRACSKINCEIRYAKLYMDDDGDVNLEYDFPMETPDSCLGEFALEMFVRFCRILKHEYHSLAQIIYAGGFKPKSELSELLEFFGKLKELRENPIVINEDDVDSSDGGCLDLSAALGLDDMDLFSLFDGEEAI